MTDTFYYDQMQNGLWGVLRYGNGRHPSLWADTKEQAEEWTESLNKGFGGGNQTQPVGAKESDHAAPAIVGSSTSPVINQADGGKLDKSHRKVEADSSFGAVEPGFILGRPNKKGPPKRATNYRSE